MNKIVVLFFVLLFISCANKNSKKDILNINDVIPKAQGDYDYENEEDELQLDSSQVKMNDFQLFKIQLDSLHFITERDFPDRFGAISSEKYQLFKADSSVKYQKWTYEDSSRTINAFYNWMDCFGKTCDSYKIGQEAKIGRSPKIIAVGDTNIILIESKKIDVLQWENYLKQKGFENWHYWIEQKPYRKAEWFEIKEEKTKIENDEING